MKKKIVFAVATGFFAVATVFNEYFGVICARHFGQNVPV